MSTVPYESRPTMVFRAKRLVPASFIDATIISTVAVLLSVLIFALFLLLSGLNPLKVYSVMFHTAFGSSFGWRDSLIRSAPLLLTALCVALPARVGMMIIGGEGALVLGGLMAALIGSSMDHAPSIIAQVSMVLGGMAVGGIWISIVGGLRQFRGVNETISGLLMNYIAIAILNHCVEGPMRDPSEQNHPSSWPISPANMLGNIPHTEIHVGLIFGIIACVFAWVLMDHTTFGFATRIVGGNVRAAKVAGISVAKYSLIVCFLGGAFAALAGVVEVAAIDSRANDSLVSGLGYAGILVAFVARQNPLAIIGVAIFVGGMSASGTQLKAQFNLSDASVQVFQGILFLVILGLDTWAGRLSEVRHIKFVKFVRSLLESSKKPVTAGVVHVS